MKNIIISIVALLFLIIGIKIFTFSGETEFAKKNMADINKAATLPVPKRIYSVSSPKVPVSLSFCGEPVPLDTFYVYEQLDRELLINMYWHSQTLMLFKRANRWLPLIEPILKEEGIPDDFKYLALVESNLQNVTSPAGAKGFWQLMRKTAVLYGLEVNREVDERYHVEKATKAACKYLKEAYKQFGNWTMAAASYNMGMGGLNNRMSQQKANSYYDLLLNDETARYVYRALAIKLIFESPKKYGFYLRESDLYPPMRYHIIKVNSKVKSWVDFAKEQGINYKMLKELNPWLRTRSLSNPYGRTYQIKIADKEMLHYHDLRSAMSDKPGIFGDNNQ